MISLLNIVCQICSFVSSMSENDGTGSLADTREPSGTFRNAAQGDLDNKQQQHEHIPCSERHLVSIDSVRETSWIFRLTVMEYVHEEAR